MVRYPEDLKPSRSPSSKIIRRSRSACCLQYFSKALIVWQDSHAVAGFNYIVAHPCVYVYLCVAV